MRFYLPIFGKGSFTNLTAFPHWADRDADTAWTNAAAHVGWAFSCPLLGYFFSDKLFWILGSVWLLWTLIYESYLHSPNTPSSGYAAEIRTDLLTRIVPTLILFLFQLVR